MIHSPKHCYPGSGWSSLSSEIIKIKVPDSNNTIEINEYILSKGDTRQLVYLRDMGIEVQSEVPLPVFYRGQEVNEAGFRLDLLVGNRLVVELKSVERVQPVHKKQLLTYLRLADKPLGLLINFNEPMLKEALPELSMRCPKHKSCTSLRSLRSQATKRSGREKKNISHRAHRVFSPKA